MDAYISVKEKYAIIKPALFSPDVCSNWGKGKAGRGFDVIRYTIANDVIKDICNIAFDNSDKNSISISSIYEKLRKTEVLTQAREWCQVDEKPLRDGYCKQFDTAWETFKTTWDSFQANPSNSIIKKIRDKIVAHLELQYDMESASYSPLNIEKEGLKWPDLDNALKDIEVMVVALHLIITTKSFSVGSLGDLEKSANIFWAQR